MFKNSNELLDYALRELEVAVANNKMEVKIVLDENFQGDKNEIYKFVDKLDIKTITQTLREKFNNYDVKSIVNTDFFNVIITYKNAPCAFVYPLVWTLTLKKKVS